MPSKIVAVTDWKAGVYNAAGLDIRKLLAHNAERRTVEGFPGGEPITNAELFKLDVEVHRARDRPDGAGTDAQPRYGVERPLA